jgi:hypothetical protein
VKFFFRRRIPELTRIVLVESGPRELYQTLLPYFYKESREIDLVTCFTGVPSSFRADAGKVFHIASYQGSAGRRLLVDELRSRGHAAIGIICADQPIMTKWKWMLAARIPAKLFVVNENGDHFWVDYSQWRIIKHFILFRAGLSGSDAVRTITQLLAFPFTVLFLLAYAAVIHARRALRFTMRTRRRNEERRAPQAR